MLPIGILIFLIGSYQPEIVEKIYSNGIFKILAQSISHVTSLVPFSIAEFVVFFFVIWIFYVTIKNVIKIVSEHQNRRENLLRFFLYILRLSGLIYLAFVLLWGLNYNRLPFAEIAGMNVQPASVEELSKVCENLIHRANHVRNKIFDNSEIMILKNGKKEALLRAEEGYKVASQKYPQLSGSFGRPKPVLLSKPMSYTGIWGVYFAFTAEANVNMAVPDSMIPNTIAHEMAHQRGFAREDEANYIAYLVCTMHPDEDFQYSGLLLAVIHSMNSLYQYDRNEYNRLKTLYSPGIINDLTEINKFSQQHEGMIEEISSNINDAYLKANRQREGVHSYGRMVDLLIAEYRMKE